MTLASVVLPVRVQRDELAFRRVGDDAGECRLARSGRAVEDERRQLIRLDGAS